MDRRQLLLNYVTAELIKGRDVKITEETDLLTNGIVDSLGLLKLVAFIENNLGFKVPDEDVLYDNFRSVRALVDYLGSLA